MAFLHGWLLALGLILPLGVQNVFVFTQGAAQARWRGALPAVLTATVCDMLLIVLAVLGLSVMVLKVAAVKVGLLVVGVGFLLYMSVMTWRSATSAGGAAELERRAFPPGRQVVFAASVSLLNPHAILDTVAVIGTSSLQYGGADKWWFTGACVLTSLLWFLTLALLGRWVGRINQGLLLWINRLSALFMLGSAGVLLWQLL